MNQHTFASTVAGKREIASKVPVAAAGAAYRLPRDAQRNLQSYLDREWRVI